MRVLVGAGPVGSYSSVICRPGNAPGESSCRPSTTRRKASQSSAIVFGVTWPVANTCAGPHAPSPRPTTGPTAAEYPSGEATSVSSRFPNPAGFGGLGRAKWNSGLLDTRVTEKFVMFAEAALGSIATSSITTAASSEMRTRAVVVNPLAPVGASGEQKAAPGPL